MASHKDHEEEQPAGICLKGRSEKIIILIHLTAMVVVPFSGDPSKRGQAGGPLEVLSPHHAPVIEG